MKRILVLKNDPKKHQNPKLFVSSGLIPIYDSTNSLQKNKTSYFQSTDFINFEFGKTITNGFYF